VADCTEALAVGEAVMSAGPLGFLTPCSIHDCRSFNNHVGTVRGSFETMPAGPGRTPNIETWPPAIPEILGFAREQPWVDTCSICVTSWCHVFGR
jgi:hypothetical protein